MERVRARDMETRDNKILIAGEDLIPGHTYEVVVVAKDEVGRQASIETSPKAVITIQGKVEAPAIPTDLVVTAGLTTLYLTWTLPDDSDIEAVQIWRSNSSAFIMGNDIAEIKGSSYADLIGSVGTTRYYWVRAKNRSGVYSDWSGAVSATTVGVAPTDISDFAITASKTFTKIPILENDAWTDDSPTAGKVAWNQHNIAFNGKWYQVAAGNSASKYIYWSGTISSGAGTVAAPYITAYLGASAAPSHTETVFVIATNVGGVHSLAWNAIANEVIGTAYILDAAITNAKIANLAVDTAQIANLAVTNGKIANLAVDEAKIANLAVTNAKINDLSADKITAGTVTGSTIQTGASGQRVVIATTGNKMVFYNASNVAKITVDDETYGYLDVGSGNERTRLDEAILSLWSETDNKVVLYGAYYDGFAWSTLTFWVDCRGVGGFKKLYVAADQGYYVGSNKVVGARVIDARCDDTINSGDATTDGVIDALRDAMIAHGLIAAS
jgi:hypothetical protein